MAKLFDMDSQKWNKWVDDQPPEVADVARRWPPNRLYRWSQTGQRVVIEAYGAGRTVRVKVSGKHNLIAFERNMAGVPADELAECDLPDFGERTGSMGMDPDELLAAAFRTSEKLQ